MKKLFTSLLVLCLLLSLSAWSSLKRKTIYVLVETKCTESNEYSSVNYTSERNTYDRKGNLLLRELGGVGGVMTEYIPELDEYGRVILRTHVRDGVTYTSEFTYDQYGNVIQEVQRTNGDQHYKEERIYDEEGNVLKEVAEFPTEKSTVEYVYENGILVRSTHTSSLTDQVTVYEYVVETDEQGRQIKRTTYVDGEETGVVTYSYSEDGLTTYTQERGYATAETVDEHGNLVRYERSFRFGTIVYEYTYKAIKIPVDYPRKN